MSGFSRKFKRVEKEPLSSIPHSLSNEGLVMIDIPAQVGAEGILQGSCHLAASGRHMVLKAVLANEAKQLLQLIYLEDSVAAKSIDLIIGKVALSNVGNDLTHLIIRGNARIGEGSRRNLPSNSPIGVFLAN